MIVSMRHNFIGNKLKIAREFAQMTQTSLCQVTGLRLARLSQLETGRRFPTRDEWKRISEAVRLGPYPGRHKLPIPQARWSSDSPLLTPPERAFATRLASARRTFYDVDELIGTINSRDDSHACYEFLESAALESGDEALFYLKLLAEGGSPCACSPQRAGYRLSPVIDPKTRLIIGDLRLPCLEFLQYAQEFLVFPQLSLLASGRVYRLDGLICARCSVQKVWINLEIDGPGHNHEFDAVRTSHLKLPTLRIKRDELLEPGLLAKLTLAVGQMRVERRLPKAG